MCYATIEEELLAPISSLQTLLEAKNSRTYISNKASKKMSAYLNL